MNRISLAMSVPAASIALVATPALAQDRLPSLAPPETLYLLRVPDFAEFSARYDESVLKRMHADPSIAKLLDDALKPAWDSIDAMLESIAYERDDLSPPVGEVGIAFWIVSPAPEEAADDDEFAWDVEPPVEHFLAFAQFGDNAEDWRDITAAWTDHLAKDREAYRIDEDDFAGRTIVSVIPIEWENAQNEAENGGDVEENEWNEDEWDAEEWNEEDAGPVDPDQYLRPERPMHFAWIDDDLVASTDMDRLERAIESLAGKDINALADSAEFARAQAMIPSNADAHAIIMLDPLWKTFLEGMGFMLGMMMGEAEPDTMLSALGLTSMRAVAAGVTLAPSQSALRLDVSVLAPERRGMLDLFDFPAASVEPPDWVGESASTYGVFRVKFDRVVPLIREVIARFPEDQRAEAEFAVNQFAAIATPVFETMGPEVFSAGRVTRPLTATSSQSLYVIPVKDELVVRNVMQLASQSMGLEARDFEGATIYSGEFVPIALGLGYSRVFAGAAPAVEDALRSAANPGGAPLARADRWREAARLIDRESSGVSWMDVVETVEVFVWGIKNQRALIEEQLDQIPEMDADTKKSILESYEPPAWAEQFPAPEVWRRHVGDLVWDFRWAADGMRSSVHLMKPADD